MPPRAATVASNSSAPKQVPSANGIEKNGQLRLFLRIPMKPAIDSDLKPASHSDFIPAGVPI
jgi:hypothetical protein